MMDFKDIDNKTLWKMFDKVANDYYKAAIRPCADGNVFLKSPQAKKLEQLTKQYEAIGDELRKRLGVE